MSEQVVPFEHFALEEREVEQALARVNVRAGDVQPLSRLQVTCIAEEGNNRQSGTFGGGGNQCRLLQHHGRQ